MMNRKILLLEDDEFTRTMIEAQLKRAGFDVTGYGELGGLLKENVADYDLILSDLNVGSSNVEEAILNYKQGSGLPLVILSQTEIKEGKADMYMAKPLTADKISQISSFFNEHDEVDISKIETFAMGDKELIKTYINTFIQNFRQEIALLEEEVKHEGAQAVQNRAHKMLSSVAYYQYEDFNNKLKKLETEAIQMTQHELEEEVNEAIQLAKRLITALENKTFLF
ncbi:response regulator [Fulvivirga sediminis]|uniref:Response regulator n=1 Tax=Fulvivirga sediminis TaxID=2803949 RepID=A0A937F240_9BACT|nr:response regulator [Fulvivirga sediminis]MBL3654876.1 response regulator [Fulvivirga sediminis]